MLYLVLKSKDESLLDEVRLNGLEPPVERPDPHVLVVELTEDDEDAVLEIGSEEHGHRLGAELIERFAALTVAEAVPLELASSGFYSPQQSTFVPRIGWRDVKPLDDPVIAGTPDGAGMPMNYVGERRTATYLFTDKPLGGDEYYFGHIRQFDTHWEPLGWALDQWIETISLAPFEDTVQSGINVASRGDREDTAGAKESDEVLQQTATTSSASEEMRTATSASSTSRGWAASVGGPPEAASTLAALARQLIGSYQVNFGSARTAASGELDADLRHDVISHL
jgi:hypothetical protein